MTAQWAESTKEVVGGAHRIAKMCGRAETGITDLFAALVIGTEGPVASALKSEGMPAGRFPVVLRFIANPDPNPPGHCFLVADPELEAVLRKADEIAQMNPSQRYTQPEHLLRALLSYHGYVPNSLTPMFDRFNLTAEGLLKALDEAVATMPA